jgi:O-antigen/teichoic acid export membrane protein
MSIKKKVLENSVFYIFSAMLIQAVGFLLLPIYTRFMTPDDFGIISLINGFVAVFTFIVSFSLYSAAVRFHADYKDDHVKLKKLYSTLVTFIILSNIIFFLMCLLFRDQIAKWMFDGISFFPLVFMALLSLVFVSLQALHQSILQGRQQGKKLVIINLIVFGLTVVLKIIFVVVFRYGAVGFLVAQLTINGLYFFYMIYDLIREDLLTFGLDKKILKKTLIYSIPLMPHNLSTRLAGLISKVLINQSGTLALVGLYSISMQFASLIDMIQTAVNHAFQPWFFITMNNKDENSKIEIVKLSDFLLILYSIIYMGVGLFSQEIIMIITSERYYMSWTIIPVLVIGFSIKSIYYFYVNIVLYYKEATKKLFIATLTGSLADILIAYLLIPLLGSMGAALAFILAKFIVVAIVVYISRRFDSVGYSIPKMLGIILPSLGFMFVGLYFSYTKYISTFNWMNFMYKILILCVYLGYIYFINRTTINKTIQSGQLKNMLQSKKKNLIKKEDEIIDEEY